MFLVILEHVVIAFNFNDIPIIKSIRNIIVTFHMPIFFILTGYLYKQKNKADNYSKIIYGLLIPYTIYQIIYLPFKYGFYVLYSHLPYGETFLKCFTGIILGDNLGISGSKYALTVCPSLWFIVVIIQIRFIFANININLKNIIIITFLAIILNKILIINNIKLYFCLGQLFYAVPYFTIGYFARNYANINIQKNSYKILILIISILLLLCIYKLKIQNEDILVYKYICGLAGSCFVFSFSQLFSKINPIVKTIGRNTLFILFFHFFCLFICKWIKIPLIIGKISSTPIKFIIWILFSVILYYFCYLTVKVIYKYNLEILLGKNGVKTENKK